MSVITDEMDRLKGIAIAKFSNEFSLVSSKSAFEFGYAYGMDDAMRIQKTIKRLAEEAVSDAGE